jgi:hypothetical protein
LTTPGHQSGSASPSWVPSYSVSRQGSPLPRPIALPSADISEIRLAPPQTNALIQEDTQNDALKDAASSVTAPTVVVDGAEAAEAEKAQPVEDRPSTPWTPSYSVTVQGADILEETAIESLSSPPKSEKAKEPEVRVSNVFCVYDLQRFTHRVYSRGVPSQKKWSQVPFRQLP